MIKAIRVLHFSPHNQDDGIAKYTEQYVAGMKGSQIENEFFDTSPLDLRTLTEDEFEKTMQRLSEQLKKFDILHIQHEFGMYLEEEFKRVVDVAKDAGKKVIISVHLSPDSAIKPVKLGGVGPRSIVRHLRETRHRNRMIDRHITPFIDADLLLVHTDSVAKALRDFGVPANRIKKIIHPVPEFPIPPKSDYIAKNLHKKAGDVIYCTVGMLHRYKGIFDAVKALKFLPENYKLAIIGGMHPLSDEVAIYNKITDMIDELNLKDRVFITGFVQDDNLMNAYIREADVCVFPYDGVYYANATSGSINLAISNVKPVIAYPTRGFREVSEFSDGAVVLTGTFAYYELARELQRIDVAKQEKLSEAYAKKAAWPKMAEELIAAYQSLMK